jgi:hypothetical protein
MIGFPVIRRLRPPFLCLILAGLMSCSGKEEGTDTSVEKQESAPSDSTSVSADVYIPEGISPGHSYYMHIEMDSSRIILKRDDFADTCSWIIGKRQLLVTSSVRTDTLRWQISANKDSIMIPADTGSVILIRQKKGH